MIGRLITRLIAAQQGWAGPFGDFNVRWLRAIFHRIRPVTDFLHGGWLGHPLHAVLTDLPIGVLTLAVIFDFFDQRVASDVCLGFGILTMLAAALAGFADYSETDEHPRMVATVHATLMIVALILFLVSLVLRLGQPAGASRTVPFALDVIGYVALAIGAAIGGEIVFTLGNMVNRHAWRFWGPGKWARLDLTEIPEGRLVKAKAGSLALVVVRTGEKVLALHDACAHAGGSLGDGTLEGATVQCPLHGSRFDMATGFRRSGPSDYDQPMFEVRRTSDGGWEARRATVGSGAYA